LILQINVVKNYLKQVFYYSLNSFYQKLLTKQ